MEAKARERLHRLIDRIPEGEVHTAERFLESLASLEDPVMSWKLVWARPALRDVSVT